MLSLRFPLRLALVLGLLLTPLVMLLAPLPITAAGPCDLPANEIVAENCLPGNPPGEWQVSGAGDPSIQGFATQISVGQGETVRFKINTDANAYRVDIYRLGYYNGDGARLVATILPSATLPQTQPACLSELATTGLVDCGNWAESASWTTPPDATSGIYIARPVRDDTGGASHIPFVVRDDNGGSDLLFQTSDTTWQAYNQYGGNSLYVGGPGTNPGRAYKVSYNRPFTTRAYAPEDWLFNAEYPMLRWLERNGYDVSYFSGVDSDRRGGEILEHKVFLSVGHDEYWSAAQRANVEAARATGIHLAFFSSNEIFWKTRWEPGIDGDAVPYRTLVSYKETHNDAKIDPSTEWTGTWRDPRPFNPEGGNPENALTGQIFTVNCCSYAITVPAADGALRFWRNTSIAALSAGSVATLPPGTLGYEWDEDLDNGARPAGLIRMSSTTVNVPERILDYGHSYGPGTATHHLTLYRHASGALVFGSGTLQWSWGLDGVHDRGNEPPDRRMQQATVNLFADMGVQPANPQSDLVAATASTDTTAPTSTITSPLNGATVQGLVTITGTANDSGGVVGGVEVSVDGGATWRPANGRESWSFTWSPDSFGSVTIRSRATDDSGNSETPGPGVTVTTQPRSCPCSIWEGTSAPANPNNNDGQPIEVGLKFRSSLDGYITALRFYKGNLNSGTHVGHLWSAGGTLLAEAVFVNESASGWQEIALTPPVAINADTTYIASYHSAGGHYAYTQGGLANAVNNPPLRALADGEDGPNAVYRYGASGFPNQSFNASNYWVDLVFATSVGPDTTPPQVTSRSPAPGATGVAPASNVSVVFNEALDPATVTGANVELRDPSSALVPTGVSYSTATRTIILDPAANLDASTSYTVLIRGGAGGVADLAGNSLAADLSWTFTTADPLPPPPDEGPGGPILVVAAAANPFGRYYAEILRAEGLNAFTVTDISLVNATVLNGYDLVILGEQNLTAAQVTLFSNWVNAGGNLIAMRPDPQLAGLLGLNVAAGSLAEGYLRVNTATLPGSGIVGETIQFHGAADRYTLSSATTVATLYSDATTATANPAITLSSVGSSGGQAAAFTYDLARSIVLTRQGNPAWAGQNRDGESGPTRSNDMFYGNAGFDPQPDWVNLNKVAIPQADEQQRLLANLIITMNADRMPLPRFWYFPRGEKAVVVMTHDDHGGGDIVGRLNRYNQLSPAGCSVNDWECIRSTTYPYTSSQISDSQLAAFQAQGHEFAIHIDTGCADFTPSQLATFYATQIPAFEAAFPNVAAQETQRTHCIAWSDWASQPKVQLQNGMRLDTNYYYWPPGWVQNRPGMFTGSGIPMRFADLDGTMIDVYQATTQMTDESGQTYPFTIDTLLDRAVGPQGYYGAFVTNLHTDGGANAANAAEATVQSALARSVPVISARQLLTWLDGRNASSFNNLSWTGSALSFSIDAASGARGLQAMLPAQSGSATLQSLTRNGATLPFTVETIKGVSYALFDAADGAYVAQYQTDAIAPTISAISPTNNATDVSVSTPVTAQFSEPIDQLTLTGATFELRGPTNALVPAAIGYDAVSRRATLTPNNPLTPNTQYTARVVGGTN